MLHLNESDPLIRDVACKARNTHPGVIQDVPARMKGDGKLVYDSHKCVCM